MRKTLYAIVFLLVVAAATISQAQQTLNLIAESHIEGNVPSKSEFDSFMNRDLGAYFKSIIGKPVEIQYEFLREGPTQTGIAYPKYYLWVKIFESRTLIDQGAVRVAAKEKKRFDVTHFLSRAEIERNPEAIYTVFPKPVCDRIKDKVKQ